MQLVLSVSEEMGKNPHRFYSISSSFRCFDDELVVFGWHSCGDAKAERGTI